MLAFPNSAIHGLGVGLSCLFLCWLGLRIFGSCLRQPLARRGRIPDRELPVYTIIAALYREARAVPELIESLRQLDYPPEKLDIKITVEADDRETLQALARCGSPRRSRSSSPRATAPGPSQKR
jgi:cellulose synthase/poly-beta-1,6-N-acetylglucosamine synthase-like glycosyltransferase